MTEYVSECEAMQWHNGPICKGDERCAREIVAWINDNGGVAWYESWTAEEVVGKAGQRIVVRTASNRWDYIKPGDYAVMGDEFFQRPPIPGPMVRVFYKRRPEEFEAKWRPKT